MVITTQMLLEKYKNYTDANGKIRRDVESGVLTSICRGLYETDKNVYGEKLAGYICGPSYLSFEFVLYKNGLIPETVYNTFTSATFAKRKAKSFTNDFGTFTYRDIPSDVYNSEVKYVVEGAYSYQIATPEKALCDKLYTVSPVKSVKALRTLLFDDLRIDEGAFNQLNKDIINQIAPLYKSTNLNLLIKMNKVN